MIMKKLLEARIKFAQANVNKTGKGVIDGNEYTFYTLNDIIPTKNNIFKELGMVDIITYNNQEAKLELFDTDDLKESITFTSPMPSDLRSVNPNQMMAIGGCQTYQRRYLYVTALDISEPDHVENGNEAENSDDSSEEKTEKTSKPASKKQTKKKSTKATKEDTPAKEEKPTAVKTEDNSEDNSKDKADKKASVLDIIEAEEETTVETTIPTVSKPMPKEAEVSAENIEKSFNKDTDIEFMVKNMSEEYALNFTLEVGKNKGKKMVDIGPKGWEWYSQKFTSDNRYNAVAKVLLYINPTV